MKKYDVFVASGGTYGHIRPALTLVKALEQESYSVLLFCSKRDKKFPSIQQRKHDILFLGLRGLPTSYNPYYWIRFVFLLFTSLMRVGFDFIIHKPKIVLSAGSFVSFPLLFWSRLRKIPYILLEQNSLPGIVSRLFMSKAYRIFYAMEPMDKKYREYPQAVLSGNPLDLPIVDKNEAFQYFGFPTTLKDKKFIGIMGGSLGARALLEWFRYHYAELSPHDYIFICITGKELYVQFQDMEEEQVYIYPFIEHMEYFYALVDMVISRAGASSISELFLYNKPVIFVPYPKASANHQYHNAQFALQYLSGNLIEQKDLMGYSIQEMIHNLSMQDQQVKKNSCVFHNARDSVINTVNKEILK